jgi:hypothetical protein
MKIYVNVRVEHSSASLYPLMLMSESSLLVQEVTYLHLSNDLCRLYNMLMGTMMCCRDKSSLSLC